MIATVWRVGTVAPEYIRAKPPLFHDFYLQLDMARSLKAGGPVYRPKVDAGLFPSSMEVYKYPPTFATLLLPLTSMKSRPAARLFLSINFALLVAFLLLMLRTLRVKRWRAALILLAFLNWQPLWETLGGLQVGILLLFLAALAWLAIARGRGIASGIALGVAGALKVYPAGLLAYFLVMRRWRVIVGAVAGGGLALLVCALTIGFGQVIDFFRYSMTRMGGTSLVHENVSVLGFAGRLASLLTQGAEKSRAAFDNIHVSFESVATSGGIAIAYAIYFVVAASLVWVTVRAVLRGPRVERTIQDAHLFCAALALLLLLMPTARIDYQDILVLPLVVLIAWAPKPREDAPLWIGIGAMVLIGSLVNANEDFWAQHAVSMSILRGAVTVLMWWGWIRMRGRWGGAGAVQARTEPILL